ncbi:N-acetylhexosaminidase [Punctularia strigosozonata HHB-11173 SS5]|uniref:N-acetylhexosaminidase n=1 Tax=Punctularia strigosozonata (strain HHB-11173) TaxID=741275 RepID=UPI0004417009|nr:N-acetylhexosaminidase [Punctularia strigosozonata HHB-11173 SS5]EIN12446.1 N-acetylhexosaminidase [Punctularia strigosozonata HHB-11173 SS5]
MRVLRLLHAVALAGSALALWPQPTSLKTGSTPLRLSPGFSISVSVHDAPADLTAAAQRTTAQLHSDKLARLVVDRGASDASTVAHAKQLTSLKLSLAGGAKADSISAESVKPFESRDESYTLTVPSTGGTATLTAKTTLGLFRGLTTFSQIWYTVGNTVYTLSAPFEIEDAPAFPYRGFMLDTARHFFPVSDIERTLDAMSWVKINTFHWHIVDSQSFPFEIPGFTEIAQKGAYSAAETYSPADVAHVVQYAAARGIDVMAEIDTPGHTAIISESHPEHIACPQATPWATFANEPPAGQLRLASPATQNFTASLLTAAAKLFPSKLFSTGGDEINANCYTADTETQQSLNSSGLTFEEALSQFTVKTHKAIEALGKTPVVWEEMVLDHNVTLSNETIILVWISSDDALAVAQKGYRFVHAPSDYFYLDCGAGGWVGDFPSGNSWCEPFKTWQRAYTFDPFASLSDTEASLVLGGQQLLWTEQSSPANLDSIVWPRAAASAELFWNGPSNTTLAGKQSTNTGVETALPRLHELAFRMQQRGVGAIALQPTWCAVRPGVCDLTA